MTINNRDVRQWARANDVPVSGKGPISPDVRSQYLDAMGLEDDPTPPSMPTSTPPVGSTEPDSTVPFPTVEPPSTKGERLPVPPGRRPKWLPRRESRPTGRRESLETLAALGWGAAASWAASAGRGPTSRVLALQAPVAGLVIDDALKGSLVDRLLQPFARSSKRAETMWSLIGPVVLVEAISRNPSRAPQLLPVLAMTLESWVDIAGPKLEAARKRQARRAEAFGESGVQEMIQMIFADIVPDQATSAAA